VAAPLLRFPPFAPWFFHRPVPSGSLMTNSISDHPPLPSETLPLDCLTVCIVVFSEPFEPPSLLFTCATAYVLSGAVRPIVAADLEGRFVWIPRTALLFFYSCQFFLGCSAPAHTPPTPPHHPPPPPPFANPCPVAVDLPEEVPGRFTAKRHPASFLLSPYVPFCPTHRPTFSLL